ncbi:hypothetical protein QCA50_006973 [Cerrena zonata]|uniref:Uncharacterized protein n=1 Tax=Cerrena zonata TaxID=2478898 RepID=A0AAW0GL60_9APHY
MENITQTQKVLLHKLEAIPDLEDALQEASARFEEARKAREQRHKADELKKELAWAHVATKQEEYEAKCRERAKLTRKLEKIEKSIEEAQAQVGKAEAVVSAHEEDMNCLGDIEELTKRLNAIKIEMRNNRTELTNLKGVEKDMNDNVTKNNALINGLKTAIQTEQERNESLTKGKRDETLKKLNDAQVAHRDADAKYKELVAKRPQLEVEVQRAGAHGKELSAEQARVKDQIVAVGGQLDLCDRREQSKLAMFGRNLESVIKEIQGTQWRGQPPVGPFGIHVKVKDARWAPLFRIQLGNAMSSWAVTTRWIGRPCLGS